MALKGVTEVLAALKTATDDVVHAVATGVYLEGNNIIGDAKRVTPLDFGVMRASLYCAEPVIEGGQVTCDVGGGGPSGAYIVKQHEGDFNHRHGTRKFLERTLNNASATYVQNVGEIALQHIAAHSLPRGGAPTTPDNPQAMALADKGDK